MRKPTLTMRQARMILLANVFAGWSNQHGTVCRPWPNKAESIEAARLMREDAIRAAEQTIIL
jgi:hypothetical protein